MSPRVAFHALGAALLVLTIVTASLDPLAENVTLWLWLVLPAGIPFFALARRARTHDIARAEAEAASPEEEEEAPPEPVLDLLGRRRRPPRPIRWGPVAGVLFWALLLRLVLLTTAPTLSDDLHRYVWEGRVTATGGDPYDQSPMDSDLANLIVDAPEWAHINHRDLPAIYPPATQWAFAAIASISPDVRSFRAAMVGVDLLLVVALCLLVQLRGLPTRRAVLYAWHPLVVLEVASSGHYEPLAMLPVVAALLAWTVRAPLGFFVLSGLAFATKYIGAAIALFAARADVAQGRTSRALVGLVVLGLVAAVPAIPFALDGSPPIGSLGTFTAVWAHNGSIYPILAAYIGLQPARLTVAVLLILWTARLLMQGHEPARGFFLLFVGLLLLSPVVHPWYCLWVIVLLPLFPSPSVTLFSVLLPLSYLVWAAEAAGEGWVLPPWVQWVEYGVPLLWFRMTER